MDCYFEKTEDKKYKCKRCGHIVSIPGKMICGTGGKKEERIAMPMSHNPNPMPTMGLERKPCGGCGKNAKGTQ